METVFGVIDEDRSGQVSAQEFVDQVHRIRSHDFGVVLVFLQAHMNDVRHKVSTQLNLVKHDVLQQCNTMTTLLQDLVSKGSCTTVVPSPSAWCPELWLPGDGDHDESTLATTRLAGHEGCVGEDEIGRIKRCLHHNLSVLAMLSETVDAWTSRGRQDDANVPWRVVAGQLCT